MVIITPEGVYTMQTKRSIIKTNANLYHKATRKLKTQLLNELVQTTHLHRKHLTVLLNNTGKVRYTPQGIKLIGDPTVTYVHKRGRKKKYNQDLLPWLKALWVLSHYRSSLHLKAFIVHNQSWILAGLPKQTVDEFPKQERLDLRPLQAIPDAVKELLTTISSATIERLLKPVKEQYKLKHRYRPHPRASVLKKQIPVEPHYDKPRGKVGYTETDTVHLSGGRMESGYCLALGDVEINLAWCEYRALRNRAHIWTEKALTDIDQTVPFRVHTRHPDGGSEFINEAILAYVQKHDIRYVRSRAYHKNDNPAVESRHFTMVRSYVGYRRYDTDAEFKILAELLPLISLMHNYFTPTMLLLKKARVGGKVYKAYDMNTPYNRALKAETIAPQEKHDLRERKTRLYYPDLLRKVLQLTKKLDQAYRNKYNPFPEDDDDN